MLLKRNRFIFNGFVFAALLTCVVFSNIKTFSYISLLIYAAYWIYLYVVDKTYFVKYLAFVFVAIGTVVGAIIIELMPEIYLVELRTTSHFSGSLPLLIFSYWIFLCVLELGEGRYGKSIKIQVDFLKSVRSKRVLNILSILFGAMSIILLLHVATTTPPALILGIDRFSFYTNYNMPWVISKIRSLVSLLLIFPLLSLVYANRFISAISLVVYLAYYLWIGEKFGAFFATLCVFLIVFYNKILSIGRSKVKRIIRYVLIIFVMLILIAIFTMTTILNVTPYEYFSQRTAQQGELWWRTYDLYKNEIHPSEFINEIKAFFAGDKSVKESIGAENGIYKVMYLCAPKAVINNKLATGSRYTQADYAVMYYYFGVPGVIVYSILMGLIISSIVNSFILSLQKKEYIKAMIYLRFFTIIRTSFSMFTFGGFLSTLSILSYAYLIFTHGRRLQFKIGGSVDMQTGNVMSENE